MDSFSTKIDNECKAGIKGVEDILHDYMDGLLEPYAAVLAIGLEVWRAEFHVKAIEDEYLATL